MTWATAWISTWTTARIAWLPRATGYHGGLRFGLQTFRVEYLVESKDLSWGSTQRESDYGEMCGRLACIVWTRASGGSKASSDALGRWRPQDRPQ
ncbi:hypothetical protein JAAARDRAFT_666148 [Jaapia argillacea MUCL 33604]|uniref:Uncharacterized protein n=1 Tax=Jaapia argillacea MUCL 33604 TaxID=933084 RepID=A0A067PU96_9AGAM|nr:hypothetical protein JAAARDRAFT_666148 [Jaapia argillacea MUCL 33604]